MHQWHKRNKQITFTFMHIHDSYPEIGKPVRFVYACSVASKSLYIDIKIKEARYQLRTMAAEGKTVLTSRHSLTTFLEPRPRRTLELVKASRNGQLNENARLIRAWRIQMALLRAETSIDWLITQCSRDCVWYQRFQKNCFCEQRSICRRLVASRPFFFFPLSHAPLN